MNKRRTLFGLLAISLAVMLVACGGTGDDETTNGGDEGPTTSSPSDGAAGDNEVVMQNIAFQPAELTVEAGTEVTWTNDDGVTHTATSDDTVWDSGNLASGESFSHTFDEAGTYTYTCRIHPTMEATITVEG